MRADVRDLTRSIDISGMRDTKPENLHVTVKFLGDVIDPEIPEIIEAMKPATENVPAFELTLRAIRYFPNPRRVRVVTVVTDEPDAVMRLHQQLDDACDAIGFRREGRKYHPHITLGRCKKSPRVCPRPEEIDVPAVTMPVQRVVLYQSVLEPTGVRYVELADVKL